MTDTTTERAAEALATAWLEHRQIPGLPVDALPTDRAGAYAIQDQLALRLGFTTAGWKVGMGSPAGLRDSGLDEPVPGRLFHETLGSSPATFSRGALSAPMVEAEFAFRLLRDLPPRPQPYGRDEVAAAVAMHLAIEVGDFRIDGVFDALVEVFAAAGGAVKQLDPLPWISDNGGGGAFVAGIEIADWQRLDLLTHPAAMWIDGELASPGLTGDGRVDPVGILAWTANHLSGRGIGLAAGAFVTSGTATSPLPVAAGMEAVARFEDLGEVRVRFTD